MLIDNFQTLVRLLLPTWLRNARIVQLLHSLLARVQQQLALASAYINKTKFDMRFTCQRQSFETLLKHYFGNESYILDHEEISNILIFGQNDPYIQIVPDPNSPLSPTIITPSAMAVFNWYDLDIYVPYGTNAEQVEALLRRYIFNGIRYRIIWLPAVAAPGNPGGTVVTDRT